MSCLDPLLEFVGPKDDESIEWFEMWIKRYYRSSVTAFDGAWHHCAITFATKIYIDGVEDTLATKVNDKDVD